MNSTSHFLAQLVTFGPTIQVRQTELGFRIPTLSDLLTFGIRGFFILAGLLALVMLLMGALAWVTSGGEKENVSKAQSKIQAAILGVIIIVGVLALIVTLEQVVFRQRICLGLSCPITIPSLLQPAGPPGSEDTGTGITPTLSPEQLTLTPAEDITPTATPSGELTPTETPIVATPTPTPLSGANSNINATPTSSVLQPPNSGRGY